MQSQACQAITFNKDSTIMVSGCNHLIKVFSFKTGFLKQFQILINQGGLITCLQYMKKSQKLISGVQDGKIVVWAMIGQGNGKYIQKLEDHKGRLNCIILNKNNDKIISGSLDKTIKVWILNQNWTLQQSLTSLPPACSLSLNNSEQKMISCSQYGIIHLYESINNRWVMTQILVNKIPGFRASFINENTFTYQPCGVLPLQVYNVNSVLKKIEKKQEVYVPGYPYCCDLFPQQQIKELIMIKNSNCINFFEINNKKISLIDSIKFLDEYLFGAINENGNYIATWDISTQKIQIFQFFKNK